MFLLRDLDLLGIKPAQLLTLRQQLAFENRKRVRARRRGGTCQSRDVAFEGALLTYEIVLADGQRVFVSEPNAGSSADSSSPAMNAPRDPSVTMTR